MTWVYIGCSTHSVPSWSKVAMRASGGTKLRLDPSIVALHEVDDRLFRRAIVPGGSGSASWAQPAVRIGAGDRTERHAAVESTARRRQPERGER